MTREPITGGEFVYRALVDAGIDLLVGIPGTQTLPLDRVVAAGDEIRYVMARHETAIPHLAWGHYETGGSVAATLTVPGPGETNAMHGLKNALDDCVPLLHISADVDPGDRGKGPIHEIEPGTYDTVVKANLTVDRPSALPGATARALATMRSPPTGPVRLGIAKSVLQEPHPYATADHEPARTDHDTAAAIDAAVDALAQSRRPAIYVGGGARRSPGSVDLIADLAERLDAPVATSYKGKGLVPEDGDRFLGVTGAHLPTASREVLAAADTVLALGTDFDGVTTDHWSIDFGEDLIHVTLDEADLDRGYQATIPVLADVVAACRAIRDGLADRAVGPTWDGSTLAKRARTRYTEHLEAAGLRAATTPLKTPAVLTAVRAATPREAIVTVDIGGFRLWAMQAFPAYRPDRFVAAGSWAGMGVGLPAAIGAKLANPELPVLSLTGDGGLLMCLQELHTAVEEGLAITVVVSDNSDYGVISKSPAIADESRASAFAWTSPDYAAIAEGFGCVATTVETIDELRAAVRSSFTADRAVPTLISADVDTGEPTAAAAGRDSPGLGEDVLAAASPD